MLAILASCKNKKNEQEILLKEAELIERQKELEVENELLIEHDAAVHLNPEVQLNLIHCENEKFIIRVDRLKSSDVRYMAWNRPKSSIERPDLILLDGEIEQQGSGGGYHFIFSNGHFTYIIENNLIGASKDATGVFLRILKNGKEELYTKMINLKL